MNLPASRCVVRLTEDAVTDLFRMKRKDPSILCAVFKKMLLLERSPLAGEPLLGALVGFRKLVVGDRHYRIVWRVKEEPGGSTVLEISEVWAVGVRSDSEVYEEMKERIAQLRTGGGPEAKPLADVISSMGRLFQDISVSEEPSPPSSRPAWLKHSLSEELRLSDEQIDGLSESEAKQLIMAKWSGQGPEY